MADDNLMNQDEVERLLSQKAGQAGGETPQPAPAKAPPQDGGAAQALDQDAIESLLNGGGASGASAEPPAAAGGDEDKLLGQDDIEKLLNQAGKSPAAAPRPSAPPKKENRQDMLPGEGEMAQGDIEYLLHQAEAALESINHPDDDLPQGVSAFRLEEFSGAPASTENATFDLIRDVELDLKIELGRTHMYLEDVLRLRKGCVVPLDKLAGDPVDIYCNGRLIARGEVLVLNDNFCVRVAELIAGVNVGV